MPLYPSDTLFPSDTLYPSDLAPPTVPEATWRHFEAAGSTSSFDRVSSASASLEGVSG